MNIADISEKLTSLILGIEQLIEETAPTHLIRNNLERFVDRLKREDSYLDGYMAAKADEHGL